MTAEIIPFPRPAPQSPVDANGGDPRSGQFAALINEVAYEWASSRRIRRPRPNKPLIFAVPNLGDWPDDPGEGAA